MEIITKSAQETQNAGQDFGTRLRKQGRGKKAMLVTLYGNLGSGKTTFVQGMTKALSIPHRILSPTFVITREYPLKLNSFDRFYHIDLYRVESEIEVKSLGLVEIFENPLHIVAIEWADRLGSQLPKERIDVYCKYLNGETRQVKIISKSVQQIQP